MNARLSVSTLVGSALLLSLVTRCSPEAQESGAKPQDLAGTYTPVGGLASSSFTAICGAQDVLQGRAPKTEKTIQMLRATFAADTPANDRQGMCGRLYSSLRGRHLDLSGVAGGYDLAVIAMAPLDSLNLSNSGLTDEDFSRFVNGGGSSAASTLKSIDLSGNRLTHLIPLRPSLGFSGLEQIVAKDNQLETIFLSKSATDARDHAECLAVNSEYLRPQLKNVTTDLDLSNNPKLLAGRVWSINSPDECEYAHWSIFRAYWRSINVANTGIDSLTFVVANETLRPFLFSLNVDGLNLTRPTLQQERASLIHADLTHLSARGTRNLPWDVLGKDSKEFPELSVLDLTGTALSDAEASLAADVARKRIVIHPELAAAQKPGFWPDAATASKTLLTQAECAGELNVEWASDTCKLTRVYCNGTLTFQFSGEEVQTFATTPADPGAPSPRNTPTHASEVRFDDTFVTQPGCAAARPKAN